eukprot:CAMPEP_0176094724 /NCGR_PEP_ID=MMETSP0120_2-20121206/47468_1 /TAXON_ID=160619 /ORGANISM="Kryptoperidinium foliaceum, Strain CCMP 1326" /LENGTH=47 /DNA_ID= /DNA_START= /DNA_END= /DNA_ORIENTATION=
MGRGSATTVDGMQMNTDQGACAGGRCCSGCSVDGRGRKRVCATNWAD